MLSKRDLASVQKQLVHYDEAREAVLSLSRTATRLAGSSILEIHRGDMEGVYDDLQTLEHTSIIPTFRVKMDADRRIIESTRGDVVTEVRRFALEQSLDRLEKRLSASSKN